MAVSCVLLCEEEDVRAADRSPVAPWKRSARFYPSGNQQHSDVLRLILNEKDIKV